jgi:hypothetical protein
MLGCMKSNFCKIVLIASTLSLPSLIARAEPLKRADVIANPGWLVHLDCDALRPTIVGQYILSQMDKPDAKDKLVIFETMFDFDLRTQLHGLTLYGEGRTPQDAVLLVYADFDPERLADLAKKAPGYNGSPYHRHVIHSWLDEKKKDKSGGEPMVYAAIDGHRVIFGQREDRVAQVLDVFDGTAPNLAASKIFPDLGLPGRSHFLEASARKMDMLNSNPNAAILKLSKSAELFLSEVQHQFQGKLILDTDNNDVADHVSSIAQGLLALMKLQNDKTPAARIANAIAIKQDGPQVIASVTVPEEVVVGMMKADAERKAARQAREQ